MSFQFIVSYPSSKGGDPSRRLENIDAELSVFSKKICDCSNTIEYVVIFSSARSNALHKTNQEYIVGKGYNPENAKPYFLRLKLFGDAHSKNCSYSHKYTLLANNMSFIVIGQIGLNKNLVVGFLLLHF